MNFFETKACKSKKHCWECRTNQLWRGTVYHSHKEVGAIDFDCPYGLTSETVKKPDEEQKDVPSRLTRRADPFVAMVSEICALDDKDSKAIKWLKHMAAQCQELYNRRIPSCAQRRRHRQHQLEKLEYYYDTVKGIMA